MEGKNGQTEKATGKQRSKAREKGQLAYSQEVVNVIVLFLGLVTLRIFSPFIMNHFSAFLMEICRFPMAMDKWDINHIQSGFISGSLFVGYLLTPISLAVILGAIISSVAQTGPYFSLQPLAWKFNGLNPVSGFQQMFNTTALVNLGLATIKMLLVSLVIYWVVHNRILEMTGLIYSNPSLFIRWTALLIYKITMTVIFLYVFLAALDWCWHKYKYERDLMMTKEEVKEEKKQEEPSPIVKKEQKKKMRELTILRMMASIPKATVVVTNPTHVAVALEYDPETMDAPKVTAKGLRLVAQRIKQVAMEHNVPILERPELARSLYKDVEIGKEIPSRFYEAVAEILAYLHKLGRRIFKIPNEAV